ncbi:MAG: hypothetical protein KJ941_06505 [Bacteroidetes bacterium]|nr:hypothetical protein [Bacteroidota bacterium]
MKKTLFVGIITFLNLVGYTQEVRRDLLAETYTTAELLDFEQNNTLNYLRKYVEVGLFVIQREPFNGKYTEVDQILHFRSKEKIELEDFLKDYNSENFNPLIYSWRPTINRQYLHISGSKTYITVPSLKDLKL